MPRWTFEQTRGVINRSVDLLENSKDPLDWVPGILSLWLPPGGYTEDNWDFHKTGNYISIIGLLLEGMQAPDLKNEFPEYKLMFMACCAKFWEDLLKINGLPSD